MDKILFGGKNKDFAEKLQTNESVIKSNPECNFILALETLKSNVDFELPEYITSMTAHNLQ